jgi:hypothetical protein
MNGTLSLPPIAIGLHLAPGQLAIAEVALKQQTLMRADSEEHTSTMDSHDPFLALLRDEAGFGQRSCSRLVIGLKVARILTGESSAAGTLSVTLLCGLA